MQNYTWQHSKDQNSHFKREEEAAHKMMVLVLLTN
jgi:hypothetical protein